MKGGTSEITAKSAETRKRILEAALACFRQRGFEAATMREIATEAGMSVGAAYYYFDSKEAIVMAFYERSQREMEPMTAQALASSRDLEERLRALIAVKFDCFAPNRTLLGALSGHTDPTHPLSPFSKETEAIREDDIAHFRQAVEGSRTHAPADLMEHLPRLLWLYQMGLILFWVYDRSAHQARTRLLFDKSLAIAVRLVKLSGLPLMRPVRRIVTDLLETIYGGSPDQK
jgi:AcrR family transcriptional regulator